MYSMMQYCGVHYTIYIKQCILLNAYCILYTLQYIQYTLYTIYNM